MDLLRYKDTVDLPELFKNVRLIICMSQMINSLCVSFLYSSIWMNKSL
jgi:hypothetical protein